MKNKKIKSAYSLLELSIVIVIISILITGGLSVSVGGINNAKITTTKERMDVIYKALGNYLIKNKKLPCPALPTAIKSTSTTYGNEAANPGTCTGITSASTNLLYGMVPVSALDLANDFGEDAFETKIGYVVDRRFTKASTTPNPAVGDDSFSSTAATSIFTINEKPAGTIQTITADAIFVLVSHGANKAYGFGANSASQNAASGDPDEADNAIVSSTFNSIFVSLSGNSDLFDDIVFYKTKADLIADFNLLNLVACTTAPAFTTGTGNASPQTGYYDQISYRGGCSNANYRASAKCGPDGNWIILAECP